MSRSEGRRRAPRLQTRVFVLIGVAVVVPFVMLGAASWVNLRALADELSRERGRLAISVAEHVGDTLRANLELLQGVAVAPRIDLADGDPGPEHAALRTAALHAHLLRNVVVIDAGGTVVAREPAGAEAALPADVTAAVRRAPDPRRPLVTRLIEQGGRRSVFLLVPILDLRGTVAGFVGGELDPLAPGFSQLLRPLGGSRDLRIEVVDERGRILLTNDPATRFATSAAAPAVTALLAQDTERIDPVWPSGDMAVVRLARAPWAVAVTDKGGTAGSVLSVFERRLLLLVPVLLTVGALFAWGAARSVTRPVAALTRAAERIGAGGLGDPITTLGVDEIGRLGQSLEAMRGALQRSLADVARANQELERRVEDRTRELDRLNRELQAREQSRQRLLRKVIVAQEDERKRIARELHDETSQTLSALAMRLETASAAAVSAATRERIGEAQALVVRAIDELHRLMFDLRPSVLDDLGLVPAIRWFADRLLAPRGVAVRCECVDIDERLPPEVEIAVFRVVQEALSNVSRHAEADTVLIQCAISGGCLVIEVEDDGQGFDLATVTVCRDSSRGLGLLGMRERMELVGGTLTIDTAPDQGVHVTVSVPLDREAGHGPDPRTGG